MDILLVGCGKMGGAMLRRWLDAMPARFTTVNRSGRALPPGTWARLLQRNAAAPADAAPPRPGCCHQAPAHYTFHAHPGPLRAAAFEAALAERP